jgi:hypothetical protein
MPAPGTSEPRTTLEALTGQDERPTTLIHDQEGPDMATIKKLAAIAAAAEAARRYAKKNPDKAGKLVDQAAGFVDKQTKGKYTRHIDGAARTAKNVAGIPATGTTPTQGVEKNAGYGAHPGYGPSTPAQPTTSQPTTPPAPPS